MANYITEKDGRIVAADGRLYSDKVPPRENSATCDGRKVQQTDKLSGYIAQQDSTGATSMAFQVNHQQLQRHIKIITKSVTPNLTSTDIKNIISNAGYQDKCFGIESNGHSLNKFFRHLTYNYGIDIAIAIIIDGLNSLEKNDTALKLEQQIKENHQKEIQFENLIDTQIIPCLAHDEAYHLIALIGYSGSFRYDNKSTTLKACLAKLSEDNSPDETMIKIIDGLRWLQRNDIIDIIEQETTLLAMNSPVEQHTGTNTVNLQPEENIQKTSSQTKPTDIVKESPVVQSQNSISQNNPDDNLSALSQNRLEDNSKELAIQLQFKKKHEMLETINRDINTPANTVPTPQIKQKPAKQDQNTHLNPDTPLSLGNHNLEDTLETAMFYDLINKIFPLFGDDEKKAIREVLPKYSSDNSYFAARKTAFDKTSIMKLFADILVKQGPRKIMDLLEDIMIHNLPKKNQSIIDIIQKNFKKLDEKTS